MDGNAWPARGREHAQVEAAQLAHAGGRLGGVLLPMRIDAVLDLELAAYEFGMVCNARQTEVRVEEAVCAPRRQEPPVSRFPPRRKLLPKLLKQNA